MGILSALNSAVGGLGAQSFALENISGNIANSATTGFKRRETFFAELVRSNNSNVARVTSGGVTASSRSTISLDGDVRPSKVGTHLAISGPGFFSVSADPTDSSLAPRYTRAGDFEQFYNSRNALTYLRNGSGYSLMGQNVDPSTGQPVGEKAPITIDKTSQSAKAAQNITYKLNLPTKASTTSKGDAWASPPAGVLAGKVTKADSNDFMDNSIPGGSVTLYDAQGTPSVLQTRWVKLKDDPTSGRGEWAMFYRSVDKPIAATDTAWEQIKSPTSQTGGVMAGGSFFFDKNGKQLDNTSSVALGPITIEGKSFSGLTMNLAATCFADKNGQANVNQLTQDGYSTGEFQGVEIDGNSGVVNYTYSNGQTVKKWQIPIVAFNGANYLKAENGGAYSETVQSGGPIDIHGSLASSALEASNVDISDEFTKLIVTQQAFAANSKVISTSNEMMQSILQIIR
ncbi:flagellar hook protein FlgE [Pleomorphomonas oryzae]|uniref:flagellar hook protein FlgE n=1 Tax=Pleomorphomonas oryzae TaxID=261934 RepID=UPI000415F184|nr:flagellar hook-basal body complex protein [Pleomorphomonas oryzae]